MNFRRGGEQPDTRYRMPGVEKSGNWVRVRLGEGEVWKAEFGMRPPARRGHRGHRGLRPGGKVEKKKACKPTGWPPARSGTILSLGEKRPRREGGIKRG